MSKPWYLPTVGLALSTTGISDEFRLALGRRVQALLQFTLHAHFDDVNLLYDTLMPDNQPAEWLRPGLVDHVLTHPAPAEKVDALIDWICRTNESWPAAGMWISDIPLTTAQRVRLAEILCTKHVSPFDSRLPEMRPRSVDDVVPMLVTDASGHGITQAALDDYVAQLCYDANVGRPGKRPERLTVSDALDKATTIAIQNIPNWPDENPDDLTPLHRHHRNIPVLGTLLGTDMNRWLLAIELISDFPGTLRELIGVIDHATGTVS